MKKLVVAGLALVAVSGCVSTSHVLEMGNGAYSVTSTADGYRTAAAARQSAFETGAAKCNASGRHFELLSEGSESTRMGIDTTVTVVFRCSA